MTATATARWRQRIDWLGIVLPAVVIYLPLLLTAPGRVGADTKTYLYLDPSRLLADAPYIWHDRIGLGTVTHQNIGYLFPIGPFYWVFETLGVPDWVAQRLWLGSILFGAALGVRYLLRTLNPAQRRSTVLVAMLAYALSPYFLAYAARISVILLPFAALPWLIALTVRAVRQGGWRYPAWFAFVVLIVGGINATALLLVGLGPLAWLVYAVVVERDATVRGALAAAARIGVLTAATSLWWIAGLFIQGTHGLPVLRYTETFRTVTEASTAPEVLRGLGYWFFYGSDKLGPWIEPSATYTTNLAALALSFAIPLAALVAAVMVRWRHRGFFAVLITLGGLTAVGGHPWEQGSVLGAAFTTFTRTDAGLALRSTPRAVPLVALGMALLLATGIEAAVRWRPRLAPLLPAIATLAVVANLSPLWTGALVADNLQRDEDLPGYWIEAIAAIDAGDDTFRVLELPGSDFAAYRWGNTVDPVTPGLTDRPWVARELFQYGSAQSANLLNAFDRRLHEDDLDPASVAPIARLLGVDTLVVRNDLQYERYRIARPRLLWDQLGRAPGLGEVRGFGPTTPNTPDPSQPLVDEIELATDPDLPDPPAVALIEVLDPLPVVRTVSGRFPMLLSGDGEGIVDAAAAGLLDANQLLLQSAWFSRPGSDPAVLEGALAEDADLVITDTNRRRAARWGTLRENNGYTERAGEEPLGYDPTDQRLDVFGTDDDDTRSVTVVVARDGAVAATAQATAWGNPITLTPDDRPMAALDGDPTTAWRVGAIADPVGERLIVDLDEPVTTDAVTLLQPTTLSRNRWITEARLTFSDGGSAAGSLDVTLDDSSRDAAGGGQRLEVDQRTFDRLEVEVLATNVGPQYRYDGQSAVGIAEVGIDGVASLELVRPPVDLLDRVGSAAGDHRLVYVFSRLRSNPAEPVRGDPETALRRLVPVPNARSFTLGGSARISAFLPDERVDELVGLPPASAGGRTASSSERLPGSLRHRASAAADGDPTTFWSSPFEQRGEVWVDFDLATPVTFDDATLAVLADGRHSVPTRVRIEAATGGGPLETVAEVDLPAVVDPDPTDPTSRNATATFEVPLPAPVTADRVRVVVVDKRDVLTKDWYSNAPVIMPVGIAEVGIDGLVVPAPTGDLPGGCRDDLLSVDGSPVPMAVTGSIVDALDRRPLSVTGCGPLDLQAGDAVVVATDGRTGGFDLDQLVWASAAGGAALPAGDLPRQLPPGPPVSVDERGRVSTSGTIEPPVTGAPDDAGGPWWLVNGQSWSDGWEATYGDSAVNLGEPVLVNGFAAGWPVLGGKPTAASGPVPFSIEWTPQRIVWWALGASAVATVVVLGLGLFARRLPRRRTATTDASLPDEPTVDLPPWSSSAPLAPGARRWAVAGGTGVAMALAAALNLPAGWVWLAPLVGALATVALRWSSARALPAVVAVSAFGFAGAFTFVQQFRNRYPSDFDWPGAFERVHVLGVVALACIGVAGVCDLVVRITDRRRTPDHDPEPATPPP